MLLFRTDNNRVMDETRERGCVATVCLRKGRPIPLTPIPYGTDEWKRLYRGRAAVEREFGRNISFVEARASFAAAVDAAIRELEQPLLPEDRAEGWTSRTQQNLLRQFKELRAALDDPEPLLTRPTRPHLATRPSIGRDLSDVGINGGRLLSIVCEAHKHLPSP